jgi:hypothetical protein
MLRYVTKEYRAARHSRFALLHCVVSTAKITRGATLLERNGDSRFSPTIHES